MMAADSQTFCWLATRSHGRIHSARYPDLCGKPITWNVPSPNLEIQFPYLFVIKLDPWMVTIAGGLVSSALSFTRGYKLLIMGPGRVLVLPHL